MKELRFSLVVGENGAVRELNAELVPTGEDRYQPVITVRDEQTGFESVTRLPVQNYASLIAKMDKDSFGRTINTVFLLVKLF